MKKEAVFIYLLIALLICCNSACSDNNGVEQETKLPYINISADEAKKRMEDGGTVVAADSKSSYNSGYIKGSVLIKDLNNIDKINKKLPDKNQVVLVYSHKEKKAENVSEKLSQLGYNVYNFGKLSEWTGEFIDEFDFVYTNLLGGTPPPKEVTPINQVIRKKINKNMLEFMFALIGKNVKKCELSDDETAYTYTDYSEHNKISKIIISDKKGNFKQTLKFSSTTLPAYTYENVKYGFKLDDFNFDGYLDIELWCWEGGQALLLLDLG